MNELDWLDLGQELGIPLKVAQDKAAKRREEDGYMAQDFFTLFGYM
jgi:hypothetical protein